MPCHKFGVTLNYHMSETVIRQITEGIWTFSRPFTRFGILPLGGRSTAIKLRDGGVWVLASTPLEGETRKKLDELGPVRYIICPDSVHHLFIGEYKKAYGSAKLIAPEAAIQRHGDKNLQFDGVWGRDPPGTKYGFEDEIQHCYFSGHKNKDVAFFHKASKSLVEADLLFNLPPYEQYSKSKSSPITLGLKFGPSSWFHSKMTWSFGENLEAMKRDAKTVSGWDFTRIIPCHGDVIEEGAKKAWNDAYRDFLN